MRKPGFGLYLVAVLVATTTAMKTWDRNMNFANPSNWLGLIPGQQCPGTIYTFPPISTPSVISLPSTVVGKQIILPSNGYLVFQPGSTKFTDRGVNSSSTPCQAREGIFTRREPADWFDPSNWIDDVEGNNLGVAHVERVPCQWDSVKFGSDSTYFLAISQNVQVAAFFLGNESLSYADLGIFMSTSLGKVQFIKKPETKFGIDAETCKEKTDCVCRNYEESTKRKICSMVTQCPEVEEKCSMPITPHGFCCPVCGFHVKIKHTSTFSLKDLRTKLKSIKALEPLGVNYYATRYKENGAHIVFVPPSNVTSAVFTVVNELKRELTRDPSVSEVSVVKSWESLVDPSASESKALGGFSIFLIVVLLVGAGAAFVWFGVYDRPLPNMGNLTTSIRTSMAWCPTRCPTFTVPQMMRPAADSAPSFAFARFANERISHLNINSAFERAEAVDAHILDGGGVTANQEAASALNSGSGRAVSVEFENAVYGEPDLVGVEAKAGTSATGSIQPEHELDLIEVTDGSSAVLSDESFDPLYTKLEE